MSLGGPSTNEDLFDRIAEVAVGARRAEDAAAKNEGIFWSHIAGRIGASVVLVELLERSVNEGDEEAFGRLVPLLGKDLEDCRNLVGLEERSLARRALRGLNDAIFSARRLGKAIPEKVPQGEKPKPRVPKEPKEEALSGYAEWRRAKDKLERSVGDFHAAVDAAGLASTGHRVRRVNTHSKISGFDEKVLEPAKRMLWLAAEWDAPGLREESAAVEGVLQTTLDGLKAALATGQSPGGEKAALGHLEVASKALEDVREACHDVGCWEQTPAHQRLTKRREELAALGRAMVFEEEGKQAAADGVLPLSRPKGEAEREATALWERTSQGERPKGGVTTAQGAEVAWLKAVLLQERGYQGDPTRIRTFKHDLASLRTRMRVLEDIEYLFPHLFSEDAPGQDTAKLVADAERRGEERLAEERKRTEAFVHEALTRVENRFAEALAEDRVASTEARKQAGKERRKMEAFVTASETRFVGALANDRVACKERLAMAMARTKK